MITGVHTLFFTPQAEELRAFIRDKLGFSYTDAGGGLLIFDLPEADMAVHPSDVPMHDISFYCDDIHATVAELKGRGVVFTISITDTDSRLMTRFKMPGGLEVELYQPKYAKGSSR